LRKQRRECHWVRTLSRGFTCYRPGTECRSHHSDLSSLRPFELRGCGFDTLDALTPVCVYPVILCVGGGFVTCWFSFKGVLPTVYRMKTMKNWTRPNKWTVEHRIVVTIIIIFLLISRWYAVSFATCTRPEGKSRWQGTTDEAIVTEKCFQFKPITNTLEWI
jgi:hypothetical protein